MVGTGAWGTTLAVMLARTGPVTLVARSVELAAAISDARENTAHLPGVRLPEDVLVTADDGRLAAARELVVMAVPSAHMREAAARISSMIRPDTIIVSVAKGIERGTLARMSQVLCAEMSIDPVRVCALSGPNLASEIAAGLPASAVVGATDDAIGAHVVELLGGPSFRLYRNRDLVGVELAGALKNIVAIAAGAADALRLGDNAKAAIVTRGLAEITRLGVAAGANALTFAGLAGIGDILGHVRITPVTQPPPGHGTRHGAVVDRRRGVAARGRGGRLHRGGGPGTRRAAGRGPADRTGGPRRAVCRQAGPGVVARPPVTRPEGRAGGAVRDGLTDV